MIVIKYVDVYDNFYDDEGQLMQELIRENFTLPTYIDEHDVSSISPFFSKKGKLFNNVSILEDRYGKIYKVVGNYKELKRIMDNPKRKAVGYGK